MVDDKYLTVALLRKILSKKEVEKELSKEQRQEVLRRFIAEEEKKVKKIVKPKRAFDEVKVSEEEIIEEDRRNKGRAGLGKIVEKEKFNISEDKYKKETEQLTYERQDSMYHEEQKQDMGEVYAKKAREMDSFKHDEEEERKKKRRPGIISVK
ncbi:MAG: hypothetical protein ISS01_01175 [Nanoarchaeota archaeon]|nr:hypothetical protein [Nanoarchaeota archaeon]